MKRQLARRMCSAVAATAALCLCLCLCLGAHAAEFRDCPQCPLMVVIPPGKFIMGSPDSETDREIMEGPQHEVTIATAFAAGKYEVRFAEWDACVAAGACPIVQDSWGRGEMPVINVNWPQAKQYAGWLSRVTGKQYRLLTEAEWEYAARAGSRGRYSWGDDPGEDNANCDGCRKPWLQRTTPVGTFKPNAFGLHDMHGNVWEWVEDVWHERFTDAPVDGSAWLEPGDSNYRVIRGGSWHNDTTLVRSAIRFRRNINVQFDTLGFRVARTLEP